MSDDTGHSPVPSDDPRPALHSASPPPEDDPTGTAEEEGEEGDIDDSDSSFLLGSVVDDCSVDFNLHPPPRLIRAEAVLAHRTSRLVLVLEHMVDSLNHQAVLRTAEAMGVQHVYTVDNGTRKSYTGKGGVKLHPTVTTGSSKWLSIHSFNTSTLCIDALKSQGYDIWVTFLGPNAHPLTHHSTPLPLPRRLAIVMGREVDGVSPAMLAVASRRVFIPQYGFTESFNVSVATALVLQRLFDLCPEARGEMREEERAELRGRWYPSLSPRVEKRGEYGQWIEKGNRGEIEWKEGDLRPKEEGRLPRVNPRQRRRMKAAGQREVIVVVKADEDEGEGDGEGDEQKQPPSVFQQPT